MSDSVLRRLLHTTCTCTLIATLFIDFVWFDLIWIHTPLWHRFRPDPWGTLCYLYRVNKTLWRRKPLAVYTTTSRRRNNDHETMYQVCIYSFHSARDAQVNSWWVSVLLDYDASFLLCSSLTIFYTTMLRSSIFDREVDFVAFVMLVIVVSKTAFSCSTIVIHWAEKYVMKERRARWEGRVWLYWIILFFFWFDLCHVDVEWIVSIDVRSQSFDDWLWSIEENAFWSFFCALNFSRR